MEADWEPPFTGFDITFAFLETEGAVTALDDTETTVPPGALMERTT